MKKTSFYCDFCGREMPDPKEPMIEGQCTFLACDNCRKELNKLVYDLYTRRKSE